MAAYKGKYKPRIAEKYAGDSDNVTYRSSWERAAFLWCDKNPSVEKWSSEEVIIPYYDPVKQKLRRYFTDLLIKFNDGKVILVEIKPAKETVKPKLRGKRKNQQIQEAATYVTNIAKWKAAESFAKTKGWSFQVWDEKTLKNKGILKW